MKIIKKSIALISLVFLLSGCENEDKIVARDLFDPGEVESTDDLDQYLKEEFRDPYGSVIIYDFVDRYIEPDKFAVPPKLELVQPVAALIKQAWINPYNIAADSGDDFMKRYFPAELVMLGSPIYNGDGTITLGIADAGVRVTLTQVNEYFPGNTPWIDGAFKTLHHEFAHIIDQNFNFDSQSFYDISGSDYTSPGSWVSETTDSAIAKGMVTPYGTSSVAEDFAELVSFIITSPADQFEAIYITPEPCDVGDQDCADRNVGRLRIQQKYDRVLEYFNNEVGVDLLKVRDEFLKSLN